jgi:hypothetical protein
MLSEKIAGWFRTSKYSTVKDWKDCSNCPLSLETMTSVVNRGKEPSVPAFIQLAYSLGVGQREIADGCKAAGDHIFYKLIEPTNLTDDEQYVIDKLKKLDPDKLKLVKDLLNTLGA